MWNILSHGAAELLTAEGEAAKYDTNGDIYALMIVVAVIALFAIFMFVSKRLNQIAEPVTATDPVEKPKTVIPKAPGAAGNLKLYNVEPKTAAMIMAIVANNMNKPLNELRFLSIKEVE